MTRRLLWINFLTLALSAMAFAADPSGKWTSSFDTQIGVQSYTFEFHVEGEALSGTATSELGGESQLQDGKFSGDTLSFVEMLSSQGMEIRITYTGILAGDEIQFTRNVADFATEQLVAKRAK